MELIYKENEGFTMREYTIHKTLGAPDWSKLPIMPIDQQLWEEPVDISAETQLCWDEENIYVRQEAWEKEIRREGTGPYVRVCDDSCLEFFFCPGERLAYFNFEVNPNGAIWLGHGTPDVKLTRLIVRDIQDILDIQVAFTPTGWVLTYHIPISFIHRFFPDFIPREGLSIRGNCYKCGDKTVHPHFIAWNPIVNDTPKFHLPDQFGLLTFGGAV